MLVTSNLSVLSQGGTTQLHWEQANIWCDYPSNVYCGDRPVCDENDENCTGGTANTPEECAAGQW